MKGKWKFEKNLNEPHAFFAYWFPMIQKVSILLQCPQILHAGYNSSIFGGFVDFYSSYDSCSSQNIFWFLITIVKFCEITALNYEMMSLTTMLGFLWITIVVLLTVKLLTLIINSD